MYRPRTLLKKERTPTRTTKIGFAAAALAVCLSMPGWAADAGIPDAISAAVADPARPAADTARDAGRKPAQTLAFAGIAPGAQIAQLMPGMGYYTRLLSLAAGPQGHVYAFYPPRRPTAPDLAVSGRAIAADAHYGNVTVLPLSYTEHALGLPQPVDVVWTTGNYHDLHNILTRAEMRDLNQRVLEALKPGGAYIVVDYAAASRGAGAILATSGIDPETVKAEVRAAGFKLRGSKNARHNTSDSRAAPCPGAGSRGSQFIRKFVKP
jgi:predicted methyltransferase